LKVPNGKGIANQTVPESCVGAPRGAARSVDRGAYRAIASGCPPKVHLKNIASLRVKHLGANEAFDKKQMQSYLQALVILGTLNSTLFFIY
jgi:hypothetical protein